MSATNINDGTSPPSGWRTVPFGEVIREAQAGFASGKRDPDGIVQLRMNNVTTRGTFDWTSVTRVPADEGTRNKYRLEPGDLLFNNTNSAELVGKSAQFLSFDEPVVYSNHFTRLRPYPDLADSRYLALLLQHLWKQGVFEAICNRWVGQAAVQRDKLFAIPIPLPPLAEQRWIAVRLGEALATVARARKAATAQVAAARSLQPALLKASFESFEGDEWPRQLLGTVVSAIRGVTFPSGAASNENGDGRIACLTTSAVQAGVAWNTRRFVPRTYLSNEKQLLRSGDILVSTANSKALVGKSCIVERLPFVSTFGAFVTVLRSRDVLLPSFLAFFLRTPRLLEYAYQLSSNTTSISNLRVSDLLAVDVPVPPINVQQLLVDQTRARIGEATRQQVELESQLFAIERLPAAMLRQAFKGDF